MLKVITEFIYWEMVFDVNMGLHMHTGRNWLCKPGDTLELQIDEEQRVTSALSGGRNIFVEKTETKSPTRHINPQNFNKKHVEY